MLPDINKEFVLRTDESDIGLGATLLQNKDGHIFSRRVWKQEASR